jgi:predicted outer membrane repeat protein
MQDTTNASQSGSAYIFHYEQGVPVELAITGPEKVTVDSSPSYTATVYYSNGCTEVVTDLVMWDVEPASKASIEKGELTIKNLHRQENLTIYAAYAEGDVTVYDELAVEVFVPRTLHVPDEYLTIQGAIDAANFGDTIIVAPGIYTGEGNRDINFQGKAITVRSTEPEDVNVVAATVIDCNGSESEPHRGFNFISGEDGNSVLAGFTIINGYGPDENLLDYRYSIGGGVFCRDTSPTISNCTFTNNFALAGGAIHCQESSNPTITNCTMTTNSYAAIGCYIQSNPQISGCIITQNSGGAIFCGYASSPTITDCNISYNSTSWWGGAINNYQDSSPTLVDSSISYNTAGLGGAFFCYLSDLTLTRCSVIGNSAEDSGGAMYFMHDCNATITDCNISYNSSGYEGGAIADNDEYVSDVTVVGCNFRGNTASGSGGAILVDLATIKDSTFIENTSAGEGGAVRAFFSTISDSTFTKNIADDGGAIICGLGSIENCTFTDNSASYGGGAISLVNFWRNDTWTTTIANCTLTDNLAVYGGGAIFEGSGSGNGNVTISNCVISGNRAWEGGGICRWGDRNMSVRDCAITGNVANNGGGIYGYGISVEGCTVIGNHHRGLSECGPVRNCIIRNNKRGQISKCRDISYNSIQDWTSGGDGNIEADPCFVEAGYWDVNSTPDDANDDFWADGDYHLMEGSPCIDAGDPNYIAGPNDVDLDGDARVVDGDRDGNSRTDMGAYEFIPPTPVEMIEELIETIGELGLAKGIENGLVAKLEAAMKALGDDNEHNDKAAVNLLEAFIHAVKAHRGKKILESDADMLISDAMRIMAIIANGG